jgi:hypothetical protein
MLKKYNILSIFQNIVDFSIKKNSLFEQNNLENFNISTNNIIHVEATKGTTITYKGRQF